MSSDRELLDDVSFDREVVPKDQEGDLLVGLFKKKAYDEETSLQVSKYPIKEEDLTRLIKEERVIVFSESPMKIYLTEIGRIVACGEFALRQRERKKAK
ncbi:hypothetical protein LCGC14_1447350 [marine sediment metagenome]|uniref:Uncharacterized protein n=1 Tax=marine sediment metagenome TaxID=412755 RepID=A0A0F9MKS7_9ZZZZ